MNFKILLGKYCSSFFSQFDVLSKEVKLYSCLTNKSRHQTAFGGFLSLIAISLMLVPSFFMFTSLFIRTGPKAYEVTKFVDDSPKISFNNENSFFILRFHSRYTEIINETSIQFYGEMRTVKAEKTIKRYGFLICAITNNIFKESSSIFPILRKKMWRSITSAFRRCFLMDRKIKF